MVVDLWNDLRNVASDENDKEKKLKIFKIGDIYWDKLMNDFNVKVEDKTNLWKFFEKAKITENIPEVLPPESLYKNEGPLEKFKNYTKDESGLPIKD